MFSATVTVAVARTLSQSWFTESNVQLNCNVVNGSMFNVQCALLSIQTNRFIQITASERENTNTLIKFLHVNGLNTRVYGCKVSIDQPIYIQQSTININIGWEWKKREVMNVLKFKWPVTIHSRNRDRVWARASEWKTNFSMTISNSKKKEKTFAFSTIQILNSLSRIRHPHPYGTDFKRNEGE